MAVRPEEVLFMLKQVYQSFWGNNYRNKLQFERYSGTGKSGAMLWTSYVV